MTSEKVKQACHNISTGTDLNKRTLMDKPAFFLNCLQCSLMYSVYDFAGLSNHEKLCDAMIESFD